jgi:hypothetical protein
MRPLLLAVLLLADDPPISAEKRGQILKDCDRQIRTAS